MNINPILLEVLKNRFASIAEEMGATLMRTAYSPNIKERRDYSCAVFDSHGDMIAQAAHIPVHLGSMPMSVKAVISALDLGPGDTALLNDPFQGGTHLPDITLVSAVYGKDDKPLFYTANRAHHADVGGASPGSMPISTSLFQEGLVIPPVLLVRKGKTDEQLLRFILSNVRTPMEREGDFAAQIMAGRIGVRRMGELIEKHGAKTAAEYARALMDYSERATRLTLARIPNGVYTFEDVLDDDGLGAEDIAVRLRLEIQDETAILDFTESDPQVQGNVNAVEAVVVSAVLYVFRCLMQADAPANAGCLRPLNIRTRKGSVVNAEFPCAVAGGNVETSQRIVDVILGALAQAVPDIVPAASQGTMNNITVGGAGRSTAQGMESAFTYYETLAGGMGAWSRGPGESGVHSHMTNTLNTPIEALEYAYPFLVTRYSLQPGSGGAGRHSGGCGIIRELEMLTEAEAVVISERRRRGPYGIAGGEPGAPGKNTFICRQKQQEMPGKFSVRLFPGDRLRMETPGGGGYGKAEHLSDSESGQDSSEE